MPPEPLSRRAFLAATGGLAMAAAMSTTELAGALESARNTELSASQASPDPYVSPTAQRFAFGVAVGPKFASGPPARVGFIRPGTHGKTQVDLLPTRLYQKGLPKGRGIYVVDAVFDVPGMWQGIVLTRGKKAALTPWMVNPRPLDPPVGSIAPRAPSPTRADPLGVHPICTRIPRCPLHTVSLADVIGAGKPVAVMFATPARCQTEYCGPVLDELLGVKAGYEQRGAAFVHVEIYLDNSTTAHSPTVDAWAIDSEPWLYTLDGTGKIVGRTGGAMGREEIVAQLDALVGITS